MKRVRSLASFQSQVLSNKRKDSRVFWLRTARDARSTKARAPLAERNGLWAVQTLGFAVADFMTAFNQMREGKYYKAWCGLEQVELALHWIALNPTRPEIEALAADHARTVSMWQSVFPYRVFASPAFRHKAWSCSICGKKSTPVRPCGHRVGTVYGGELCVHRITDTEILEISMVRHPVQKYSVLTPGDGEHDFSAVDYVMNHLSGPFHRWYGEWGYRRHDHSRFSEVGLAEPCPCDAGLRYGECCRPKSGVRLRHFAIQVAGNTTYQEGVVSSGVKERFA